MQTFKSYLVEDANYKVEIEGLPTMFIGASSPADLKMKLRKMLKKADMITSVTRVVDGEVRKHFRLKAQGKDEVDESTQVDEISTGKMAAYADKAVKSRNDAKAATHSADTHRVAKAGETIRKRKAGADNYNKKMWGYGNVAPTKK